MWDLKILCFSLTSVGTAKTIGTLIVELGSTNQKCGGFCSPSCYIYDRVPVPYQRKLGDTTDKFDTKLEIEIDKKCRIVFFCLRQGKNIELNFDIDLIYSRGGSAELFRIRNLPFSAFNFIIRVILFQISDLIIRNDESCHGLTRLGEEFDPVKMLAGLPGLVTAGYWYSAGNSQ